MATDQTARNQDWFKAQQQYWDALLQGQNPFFDTHNPAAGLTAQWDAFFREWQKLTTGSATPAADSYRAFFTQAGKGFLDMIEKFAVSAGMATTAGAQKPEDTLKAWTDQLQKFYGGLLQQNAQPFDFAAQFKNFSTAFNTAPFFAQGFAGTNNPYTAAAGAFDPFGFYASLPGIGYTREKQDSLNQLYHLWTAYETQMRRYNTEMTQVALQALQKFQEYIVSPPEGAKPLESLKDIYVKFVDVSEDVFAAFAVSDAYTTMYGDVVNALTAFKKKQNEIADETLEQFNIPGRGEVDTLHKRMHDLRRENLELKKEIAEIKTVLGLKKPAPKAAPAPKAQTAKPATKAASAKPAAKKAAKKAGKK